ELMVTVAPERIAPEADEVLELELARSVGLISRVRPENVALNLSRLPFEPVDALVDLDRPHGRDLDAAAIMCYDVIADVPTCLSLEVIDVADKRLLSDFPNLIKLYESGKSRAELKRHFGVTDKVIRRLLIEAGTGLRDDHKLSGLPIDEITCRYEAGESE